MPKRLRSQQGFSSVEAILVIVAVAIIAGIGWYVYHTKQNTDNALNTATETSNNAGPHFSNKKATASGSSTSKSSLQVISTVSTARTAKAANNSTRPTAASTTNEPLQPFLSRLSYI